MNITGKSLINGTWQVGEGIDTFFAFVPQENRYDDLPFYEVSQHLVESASAAAEQAFKRYRKTTPEQRADFLDAIAENILALGNDLIHTTMRETGLPEQRLEGERMRTVNQLRFFANDLRANLVTSTIEDAQPERAPLPKPETELTYIPVGPVAVFGASNFPYAFSTLGGDTASALAAGCTVVVKGHPAHPATSELMANAILKAIKDLDMPLGVFALLQTSRPEPSHQLVKCTEIKAVGFTGSFNVASSLQKSIHQRQEVIPLYGELGSINPQVILPKKVACDAESLAQALVDSLMMGQGQFCTSPGVWLLPANNENFLTATAQALSTASSAPLLTPGILANYQASIQQIRDIRDVSLVGQNSPSAPFHPQAQIVKTNVKAFLEHRILHEETFGPSAVIVEYDSVTELMSLIEQLQGQLTASIHGLPQEIDEQAEIVEALSFSVGRLILNQMPTGVEVCATMNHGGPFPSSTDVRTTSVGLHAKDRFLRPICYQR